MYVGDAAEVVAHMAYFISLSEFVQTKPVTEHDRLIIAWRHHHDIEKGRPFEPGTR